MVFDRKIFKKKIIFISPSFAGGGAEYIAVSLLNYFYSRKYQVLLLCFKKEGPFLKQLNKNIKIININSSNKFVVIYSLIKILNKFPNSNFVSTVRNSNILLGVAMYFRNKSSHKIIFREAATFFSERKIRLHKRFIRKLLLQIAYFQANLIIANSNDVKNQLKKQLLFSKKIIKIYNPALRDNLSKLRKAPITHKWFIEKKYKILITVGRLVSEKNHKYLIESMQYLIKINPKIRLLIIGSGYKKRYLKNIITNFKLEKFVDIIPFQINPYPYLVKSDLFLMSSLSEGFGNVFIDAASCGLKIISSDCAGGPRELLKDKNIGEIYDLRNNDDFKLKVIKNLSNTKSYSAMKSRVTFAKNFSLSNVGEKYLEAII